jgi:hypothetical protein
MTLVREGETGTTAADIVAEIFPRIHHAPTLSLPSELFLAPTQQFPGFPLGDGPLRLFPLVGRLYFDDEIQRARFQDRNLWSLNNAFTEAVKELRMVPQNSCGLKTGQSFGRVIHR